ncbi:unnamed protein product [Paramecium octaurelia]|uniref:Uncharacterized protein n=1 Tax=Paramecium octaurelia TaxID=43137 RepID=A0A8S1V8E6_PAROT|nr:unnamed protein product [Paramecium octaurelia]
MDYNRNDIITQELKAKFDLDVQIKDPQSRLFLKGYFKSDSEIHSSRFDKDDIMLALGCSSGLVCVYDLTRSEKTAFYTYLSSKSNMKLPCTALRWFSSEKSTKMRQVLISANTDGTIMYKNVRTDSTIYQFKEEDDNEVYCIDALKNQLATCGKDCKVRVYDIEAQTLQATLEAIQWVQPGHNNRLFSVKIVPYDKNLVISGGWDQNIVIWDLRQKSQAGCIVGPKVAGDTIDIREGTILTGANRMSEQLQIWDLGTLKLIENIKWDEKVDAAGAFIYGSQFGKGRGYCVGGVAHGTNEFKMFDRIKGSYKEAMQLGGFKKGLYTMDFANTSNKCVIGGGDGLCLMLAIVPNKDQ